jgi:hypothetical protein
MNKSVTIVEQNGNTKRVCGIFIKQQCGCVKSKAQLMLDKSRSINGLSSTIGENTSISPVIAT